MKFCPWLYKFVREPGAFDHLPGVNLLPAPAYFKPCACTCHYYLYVFLEAVKVGADPGIFKGGGQTLLKKKSCAA